MTLSSVHIIPVCNSWHHAQTSHIQSMVFSASPLYNLQWYGPPYHNYSMCPNDHLVDQNSVAHAEKKKKKHKLLYSNAFKTERFVLGLYLQEASAG